MLLNCKFRQCKVVNIVNFVYSGKLNSNGYYTQFDTDIGTDRWSYKLILIVTLHRNWSQWSILAYYRNRNGNRHRNRSRAVHMYETLYFTNSFTANPRILPKLCSISQNIFLHKSNKNLVIMTVWNVVCSKVMLYTCLAVILFTAGVSGRHPLPLGRHPLSDMPPEKHTPLSLEAHPPGSSPPPGQVHPLGSSTLPEA